MRSERIVLGEGKTKTKKAGDIVIPDIRCLAPCLDKNGECLLLWSHRVATETLDKIHQMMYYSTQKATVCSGYQDCASRLSFAPLCRQKASESG